MDRRRLALFAALSVLALGLVGLLARDLPVFAVEDVRITGLSGDQAPQVRSALERAAQEMTTLHVREDELLEAVSPYTTVATVEVQRDLPHALRIDVSQRRPVAVLGGLVVTEDLRTLRGVPSDGLPVVRARGAGAGRLVRVLAAAPDDLRTRVSSARLTSRGVVLKLRRGPELVFGDTRRPRAKWLAAAAVLADTRAAGASYVDLRVPERPAAGGAASTMG